MDENEALRVGQRYFKELFGEVSVETSKPSNEIWVDKMQKGYLTWTFTVKSTSLENPLGIRIWISAVDKPDVLSWENIIYRDHNGVVSGTIWETSPLGSTANQPMPHMEVTRTGGGGGTTWTDENGQYSFSGTGIVQIQGNLQGKHCRIQNMAGSVMSRDQNGDHNNPINLNFNAANEFELAQVTAYYWTNIAHDFAKDILGTGLSGLPARVNINDSCNAYWDGSSINFFRAGGSCPNTAYADVVLHEYGHGIDDVLGGIIDGGYSEGFGDAMTILVTRQPCLGRDFLGTGSCLRDATEIITWPPSNPEVHYVGRIYAGFTWELIQQLLKTYPENEAYEIAKQLVLAAAAGNPSDIPDAVKLSFIADDDDNDLSNCTPHYAQLSGAASSRGIPYPECGIEPGKESCCAVSASAQFSFTENKKATGNTNILMVNIHLDREMEVHIQASTSAISKSGAIRFRTGFYNQPSPNIMWTNSLRDVTIPKTNQWVNFGSSFTIRLQPGNHTIYWKIWAGGGELQFSSGVITVEAFSLTTGASLAPESIRAAATQSFEHVMTSKDESGADITWIEEW